MTSLAWGVAALVLTGTIFVVWVLVQWTKQPRRYFRAGYGDPDRRRFATRARGRFSPQTVEEPPQRSPLENSLDEEVAMFVEGERHEGTPITTNLDREAELALEDEPLEDPADDPSARLHRPEGRLYHLSEIGGSLGAKRRRAAAEHRRAAEEHQRAAETISPDSPADEPANGHQQPRRR